MKVFSVIVCIFVLLCLPIIQAKAEPFFLVCDPQAGVTHYEVVANGLASIVDARPDTRLAYDLGPFPVGVHNFEVSAIAITNEPGQGSWGQSDAVPFVGTRIQVNPVSGLSVRGAPF